MEIDKPDDNVSQLRPVAAHVAVGAVPDGALEAAGREAEGLVTEGAGEPAGVPAPAPAHQAAGIPSEHQDHALNLMSDTIQPQLDRFKSWSENISTEINARSAKYDADRAKKVAEFEAQLSREDAANDEEIAGLRSLQDNVGIGFKVLTDAVTTYTDLVKPIGRNLREAADPVVKDALE